MFKLGLIFGGATTACGFFVQLGERWLAAGCGLVAFVSALLAWVIHDFISSKGGR